MRLVAALSPELLKAIAAACVECWREDCRAPLASALYLMDDYVWALSCQRRLQVDAVDLARDNGWQGSVNDLLIAAHREMYARSGNDADLAKMLRHVT